MRHCSVSYSNGGSMVDCDKISRQEHRAPDLDPFSIHMVPVVEDMIRCDELVVLAQEAAPHASLC